MYLVAIKIGIGVDNVGTLLSFGIYRNVLATYYEFSNFYNKLITISPSRAYI